MAGQIYHLEQVTTAQLESLDRLKTVFFLPISPLEEHGPHLPVGVDLLNAAFFARQAAEMLVQRHPAFDAVIFPSIPLGTQVYRQLGSFYIKPPTLFHVVYQLGKNLARYGFTYILAVSGHGTPKHIVAIEKGCRKVRRKYKKKMYCLTAALTFKFLRGELYENIALRLGRPLREEEKHALKYDFHAGIWETSMLLRNYPELVTDSYRTLKPYLKDVITGKVVSDNKVWQGYVGAPALASMEFAEASLAVFGEEVAGLLDHLVKGTDISRMVRSPFYHLPIFHPFFRRYAIGAAFLIFLLILYLAGRIYF